MGARQCDRKPGTFDVDDRLLNPCGEAQLQTWTEVYETPPDAIPRGL